MKIGQSGAANLWRVWYQQGLPRLVFFYFHRNGPLGDAVYYLQRPSVCLSVWVSVLVLQLASVKRFGVSHMRDIFLLSIMENRNA